MTRSYGEMLGDALQDIINPPPPHIYFIKEIRDLLTADGWDRITIRVGRIIEVSASRDEDGTILSMNQHVSYQVIEGMKYPRHAVQIVIGSYRRSLSKWRTNN